MEAKNKGGHRAKERKGIRKSEGLNTLPAQTSKDVLCLCQSPLGTRRSTGNSQPDLCFQLVLPINIFMR